ncbi:DUF1629 domain-containing protein [Hyphomicrobium sp. CS1GBMeth3]|uniref:imm11 family protein n=1 Tax=Hyphomicrobium sp. CS1GBMeth3 TaxID=1892845 RepID=UPI000930C170|nr:DUF1629 domain-containing protein [Hyphomicrobium sp. CS1GBMeth3]
MAYDINHISRAREYAFGISWGNLYGKPGPLTVFFRDEDLSPQDVVSLAAAPVKIRPSLVQGAPLPELLGVDPCIVSARALKIISEFQPQGILSIPLSLLREEDDSPVPDYFLLQVRTFIDCIDFDATQFTADRDLRRPGKVDSVSHLIRDTY